MSETRIVNGVVIDATFAEAFPMKATRIVITAISYSVSSRAMDFKAALPATSGCSFASCSSRKLRSISSLIR